MENNEIKLDVSSMIKEIEARTGLLNQYMLKSQDMFKEVEDLIKQVINDNPTATREEIVEKASEIFEQRQEKMAQQNGVENKEDERD